MVGGSSPVGVQAGGPERNSEAGAHRARAHQEVNPVDERGIALERGAGAPQIQLSVATSAAAFVIIALSKVAPADVRTEGFRISVRGRLSTTARFEASAAMLLHFKQDILGAARKADKATINVVANETWAEL